MSDHLGIYAVLHKPIPRHQQQQQKTLSKTRYQKHKAQILQTIKSKIESAQPATTTDQQFSNIQKSIQQAIEKHEKKPKPRRKPWCDPKLKRQIRKQHRLHQRMIRNPTLHNKTTHAAFRNRLRRNIRKAKRDHLKKLLEQTKNDPKKQARILKSVIPSKQQNRAPPTTITYKGKSSNNPADS